MNSEKNGDLRNSRVAVKTVKGFTLIEMLIVIAILGILAGTISLAIMGFVRDTNIETLNNKAQQAYTSLQNVLIETEIKQNKDFFDTKYIESGSGNDRWPTMPPMVSLEYYIEAGQLDIDSLILGNWTSGGVTTVYMKYKDHKTKQHVKPALNFFKKYIEDTITSDFTGYVYACIDIQNYTVESVMYNEEKTVLADVCRGPNHYADVYTKTGYTDKHLFGTADFYSQRDDYKRTGIYLGYYPYMDIVGYKCKTDIVAPVK